MTGAASTAVEGRLRKALRFLATPLALAAVGLTLPAPGLSEGAGLVPLALVLAIVLAAAALVGAGLDVSAERRTGTGSGGHRLVHGLSSFAVPAAVAVVPVVLAVTLATGVEGRDVLGVLSTSLLVAGLVAFVGLLATVYAVLTGRYPTAPARMSVLNVALAFLPLILFLPLQQSGVGFLALLLAALFVLTALAGGALAVASREPTLRLGQDPAGRPDTPRR